MPDASARKNKTSMIGLDNGTGEVGINFNKENGRSVNKGEF